VLAARVGRPLAVAAAILFAAFVVAKGIPTLRHDWTWPVDRTAIESFLNESFVGWLPGGFGTPNPHPTTYLIALPLGVAIWLLGPLAALALFAAVIGYVCMRCSAEAASQQKNAAPAALGLGLFALFNPWVYNEVVAGHLVMVLAYGGLIGLFAEMIRGPRASPVRLALWIALIEAQLQFFIVAMLALAGFALATRKWLPVLAGALFALPSIIGLVAERAALLRIPYVVTWQTNQSVAPLALLGLGGYFPGYADRLGGAAAGAVWIVVALALAGALAAGRSRAAIVAIAAAVFFYVVVIGVHGPLAAPYMWIVRNVPESGVFRELYDLAGVFAALVTVLACAATARVRGLAYLALGAGIALPITWLFRPPSDLWIAASSYPHPEIAAAPFTRIALLPAFQPLGLRAGGGDGADPDAHGYPDRAPVLNEYFPAYPVDVALARYEQSGDVGMLRALGVTETFSRSWLISRMRGAVGLAATSLEPRSPPLVSAALRHVGGAIPLISECERIRVVRLGNRLGGCGVFFGDLPGYETIRTVSAPSDSIDPASAWIDARLAFAESPALAQGIGGALTQSRTPHDVEPGSWLLAYVRGTLDDAGGRTLVRSPGAFVWVRIPRGVASVRCAGLCELIAQTARVPNLPLDLPPEPARALEFRALAPWLYIVRRPADSAQLLRFNERYDPAWIAIAATRILPHLRIDLCANGWLFGDSSGRVFLVHSTSLLQLIAEVLGILYALWLLKALARAPTKRAS
jgi:hypothetical protein